MSSLSCDLMKVTLLDCRRTNRFRFCTQMVRKETKCLLIWWRQLQLFLNIGLKELKRFSREFKTSARTLRQTTYLSNKRGKTQVRIWEMTLSCKWRLLRLLTHTLALKKWSRGILNFTNAEVNDEVILLLTPTLFRWHSTLCDYFPDRDHNGVLSFEEIRKLVTELNINMPNESVRTIFQKVDLDSSGQLDKDEFIDFVRLLRERWAIDAVYYSLPSCFTVVGFRTASCYVESVAIWSNCCVSPCPPAMFEYCSPKPHGNIRLCTTYSIWT